MEDTITDYIIDVEQDTTNHVIKSAKYYKRALLQRNITDTHYINMEDIALREEMLSLRDASKGFAGTPAYKYHMVNTVLSEYTKRCSSREFYVELFLLREDYLKYREHAVLGINYDEVRSEFYEQKGNAELSLTVQEYITGHLVEWKEKLMKIEDFLLKPPLYEIDSWQTYDISFYNGKCFRAEIHPGKTIIYMKNTYGNEYYQDFNEEYHINQIVDYIKGREGIQQFKLDL